MTDLKVIENEIVPVYETEKGIKVVNGRELHVVLESKQDFSTWVKRRLSECDAEENEDFERLHKKMEANNATMIDYIIKLDTAKEMAMLERNEKGKQVRKYFIAVEKKYKEKPSAVPMSPLEQLQLQAQAILQVNEKVDALDKELERFKLDLPILPIEADRITEAVRKRGVDILGGKSSNAYQDRSMRQRVYSNIYADLKSNFRVRSYKSIRRNQCESALNVIARYDAPLYLQDEIFMMNNQRSIWDD